MKQTGRKRMTITLAALALAACAPAVTVNRQAEEAAIRAADNDFLNAATARNVDRLVSWYAPDAISMTPNSPVVTGTSAIRASWTEFVNQPGFSFTFRPTRIDITASDAATDIGTYQLSYNGPNGQVTDAGNYITNWRKIGGQWRIVSDAAVSTRALSAATAGMPTDMTMTDMADVQMLAASGLAWADFSPPGFDPGIKITVLHGDPGKKGDYTLRLQFPDGYRFPVHWHPGSEHVSILSGTFMLGMGKSADWNAARTYAPGDFIYIPPRHPHFGGARGVTMIQLHGEGPFQLFLGVPK